MVTFKSIWFYIYLSGAFLMQSSCNTPSIPNLEKEKAVILQLEAKQRAYHFTKNAAAFVNMFSSDFSVINNGKIESPSLKESYEQFNIYFKSVDFIKWDNEQEPVIRFSADASIAYVMVSKVVVLKLKNTETKSKLEVNHFSWLTVYKKVNNSWKIDCIASTKR